MERYWYPEGSPAPSSSRWGVVEASLAGLALAGGLIVLLGVLVYPSLLHYLPWTLAPLLGGAVGAHLRRRRELSGAAAGLYPLHVRPARSSGRRWRRWRYHQALSEPGVILA